MSRYFPRQLLFRLRNEIPLEPLIRSLQWPHKHREGSFVFVCPRCGESLTGINPHTNLGRCFRCDENFNPIDFVMQTTGRDFVETVEYLSGLLSPPASSPSQSSSSATDR